MVQDQIRAGTFHSTQDEYDDLVVSNIELTTDVESDDNYALMFVRKKKEAFLTLNDRARQDLSQVHPPPHTAQQHLLRSDRIHR